MRKLITGSKKGSATSVVLITFAILIYIVIPLGKSVFEQVFFEHLREKMIVTMDSAVFAAIANIDTELYSEKRLEIMKEKIEDYILKKIQIIIPQHIDLTLDERHLIVEITFKLKSIFRKGESLLKVRNQYRFEELNQPAF